MWLPSVTGSLSRALGCQASFEAKTGVNPLVYTVDFIFGEEQQPKRVGMIWNLVQMYAARNDAHAKEVLLIPPSRLRVIILLKRRIGPPKAETP